ncbi:hypothetical protein NPIL_399711 [Nephila pilipes]|uniref:Uncharacterized protein n=1 Tax=Nephila pilipes TaxID=299642 RepID=A0A8X6QXB1_NEPPI|nr:hypothetical protein NPIL_399711 [Nephila pilipes]
MEIEDRFLQLKAGEEKLAELKKSLAKTLFDLKTEKKQLESRMELLRGANAKCPRRELEYELGLAKSRLEEQEMRIKDAKFDLENIDVLLSNVEMVIQKLEEAIRKKMPDLKSDASPNPNLAATGISSHLEEILSKLETLNFHDVS